MLMLQRKCIKDPVGVEVLAISYHEKHVSKLVFHAKKLLRLPQTAGVPFFHLM